MELGQQSGLASVGKKEMARLAWLALVMTPAMGAKRIWRSMERLGEAARLFEASLTELESLGMPAEAAQFVFDGKAREAAENELARVIDAGGAILTPEDEVYPERLREIYDPPAVMWVRGNAALMSRPGIAVVGRGILRRMVQGWRRCCHVIWLRVVFVILSGMARGVDTAAHKGALDAKGKTVAVWGTGIDVIYPKENKLAENIVASGGTIVSEFALGTFPALQNFPIRNRILSRMSVGVLVIEAAEYNGTRITARLAMEQNRDVFAVPGNVTNKNSWGPNTLIKQGAKLTATWEDVWEELPSQVRLQLSEANGVKGGDESKSNNGASLFGETPLGDHERLVLERLRHDEVTQLDELIECLEAELASAEIFTALFEL